MTAVVASLLVLVAGVVLRGPSSAARLDRLTTGERAAGAAASGGRRVLRPGRRRAAVACPVAERWAAALRSGRGVDAALLDATSDPVVAGALRRTVTAARLHGDLAAALRADADEAEEDDAAVLRALAACWTVGGAHGARLAAAVEQVA